MVTTRVVDCVIVIVTLDLPKQCMAVIVLRTELDKLGDKYVIIHLPYNRYT